MPGETYRSYDARRNCRETLRRCDTMVRKHADVGRGGASPCHRDNATKRITIRRARHPAARTRALGCPRPDRHASPPIARRTNMRPSLTNRSRWGRPPLESVKPNASQALPAIAAGIAPCRTAAPPKAAAGLHHATNAGVVPPPTMPRLAASSETKPEARARNRAAASDLSVAGSSAAIPEALAARNRAAGTSRYAKATMFPGATGAHPCAMPGGLLDGQ